MLHCRDGLGLVMSGAWFPPNKIPDIHTKEFNLCLITPKKFVSHGQSPPGAVWLAPDGLPCPFLLRSCFRLATLEYKPDWWIASEMVVLGIWSSLHRGMLEL
ncbi:hypothetical protein ILYODFUR_036120 [Ilyodon furcidens]|uniref:Uncharacterized protein n=1 Tax=Ilyodon furcidens TaxID=33524 RepID=A0ABV0ULV5_9TELE